MPFLRQFRDSFRSKPEHGKTCMQGCKNRGRKSKLKNQKLITGNEKRKEQKNRTGKIRIRKKWIRKKRENGKTNIENGTESGTRNNTGSCRIK